MLLLLSSCEGSEASCKGAAAAAPLLLLLLVLLLSWVT
jgi:hypothetical protein